MGKRNRKKRKEKKMRGFTHAFTHGSSGRFTNSRDDEWEAEIDIIKECGKCPDKVIVSYYPLVRMKIDALMKEYKNREWLAYLIGKRESLESFTIEDLFIPKQDATSTSVDNINCEEYNQLSICGVIHSHHTMGNSFSGTDDNWINMNHDLSLLVSHKAISGQARCKLSCGAYKIVPTEMKLLLQFEFDEESFIKDAKEKIGNRTYTHSTYYDEWGYGGIYGQHQHTPGKVKNTIWRKVKCLQCNTDIWEPHAYTCRELEPDFPYCKSCFSKTKEEDNESKVDKSKGRYLVKCNGCGSHVLNTTLTWVKISDKSDVKSPRCPKCIEELDLDAEHADLSDRNWDSVKCDGCTEERPYGPSWVSRNEFLCENCYSDLDEVKQNAFYPVCCNCGELVETPDNGEDSQPLWCTDCWDKAFVPVCSICGSEINVQDEHYFEDPDIDPISYYCKVCVESWSGTDINLTLHKPNLVENELKVDVSKLKIPEGSELRNNIGKTAFAVKNSYGSDMVCSNRDCKAQIGSGDTYWYYGILTKEGSKKNTPIRLCENCHNQMVFFQKFPPQTEIEEASTHSPECVGENKGEPFWDDSDVPHAPECRCVSCLEKNKCNNCGKSLEDKCQWFDPSDKSKILCKECYCKECYKQAVEEHEWDNEVWETEAVHPSHRDLVDWRVSSDCNKCGTSLGNCAKYYVKENDDNLVICSQCFEKLEESNTNLKTTTVLKDLKSFKSGELKCEVCSKNEAVHYFVKPRHHRGRHSYGEFRAWCDECLKEAVVNTVQDKIQQAECSCGNDDCPAKPADDKKKLKTVILKGINDSSDRIKKRGSLNLICEECGEAILPNFHYWRVGEELASPGRLVWSQFCDRCFYSIYEVDEKGKRKKKRKTDQTIQN